MNLFLFSPLSKVVAIDKTKGFSLIELMVSITIGFLVVGSAIAIFASNRQTYVATENIGRIQENMRIGYELMARDIREAAGTPCAPHIATLRNVINAPTTRWWTDSSLPLRIRGYTGAQAFPAGAFGTADGDRIAGTQAIQVLSTSNSRVEVRSHNTLGTQFVANTAAHGIVNGDLLVACDYERASLFQVSSASPVSANIDYAAAGTPGNTGSNIRPDDKGNYARGSVLAKWHPVRWYIGASQSSSGRSLYQITIQNGALSAPQEVAQNVQDLNMTYLENGIYQPADAVINWTNVTAVRVNFILQGDDSIGTDGNRIQRTMSHTIALRMRNK